MAKMGSYTKAYMADRFREYAKWSEKPVPPPAETAGAATADSGAADAGDSDGLSPFYFLQENYVVTTGIFLDEGIVFDDVTDEWVAFCTGTLGFEPPPPIPDPPEAVSAAATAPAGAA